MKKQFTKKIAIMSGYMILGAFLQCVFISLLFADNTLAQKKSINDIQVSLSVEGTVLDVFKAIEQETDFYFSLNHKKINENKIVRFDVQDETLKGVLEKLSREFNLEFKRINQSIHVFKLDDASRRVTEEVSQQQSREVTGTVTDQGDNSGLPGVNVVIKGTSQGTITDVNGYFKIDVSSPDAVLSFSSIGYVTEEIVVGNRSVIDLVMRPDVTSLDEIVVVGYGTQKKQDLTGAISTIEGESINNGSPTNFLQNLQGQSSGLQVSNSGGQAGASSRIRIRGINSISSSTDPLWVIDGLILSRGDFETINPADIKSIEVLKDAAATAIYGSRGSNGVIIVTTKKGTSEETRTNISVNTGVTELTRKPEDIGYLSTSEFFDMMDQARINTYGPSVESYDPDKHVIPSNFLLYPNVSGLSREEALATNSNWYDEAMRMGSVLDVNASAAAQKEKLGFYVSLNYRDETGVVKLNDSKRYSGLVNLDFNVVPNLKIETKVNLSYTTINHEANGRVALGRGTQSFDVGGFAGAVDAGLPWIPIYNEDGSYWNPTTPNIAMLADPNYRRSQTDRYRALVGLVLEYSVPWIEGLRLRATTSNDINYSHYTGYIHQAFNTRGVSVASDNSRLSKDMVSNFYALFDRSFGKHNFNISAGVETQRISAFLSDVDGEDIIGQYQQVGTPGTVNGIFIGVPTNSEHNLIGYFGRASYNFDNRYLLSVSMRRDGSSRFSDLNRWELFPAVGVGWVPSAESFWNVDFVDFLKIRGSYGKTGNQNIPEVTVDIYSNTLGNRYGDIVASGTQLNVVGSDVTWEVTNATDIGVDFELFEGGISGSAGYYKQDISRLLLAVPIPNSAGYNQLWSNIGDMTNQGWEFSLASVNVNTENFYWRTNFNFTTNSNEITKLTPDLDNGGKGIIVGKNITRTGSELGMFYLAEYAGINPDNGVEQIYEVDQVHYEETGETVFVMEDGQPKKIPATPANIQNNRYIQEGKSGLPSFFGGIDNSFRYKQLDLSFLLYFQGGNYILDWAEMTQSYPTLRNMRRDAITDAWTEDNRDANWPELRFDYIFDSYDNDWNVNEGQTVNYDRVLSNNLTSKFLHKADFMRLKNIQVGYNFPNQLTDKLKVNAVRVYLQATNLFTLTGYKGYDPDITGTSGGNSSQSINLTQGYVPENIPVPAVKTYSVGVNVQF